MRKSFLFAAVLLLSASFAGRAQYIPVEDNPLGPRPVSAPIPTTVAGVSEPTLIVDVPVFAENLRGRSAVGGGPVWQKKVTVPSEFAGKRVCIRFDGTGAGATLYVNGQKVREHWAHTYSWGAEVTDFLTAGQEADLKIEFAARGGMRGRAGGISGNVTLFAVPDTYVQRMRLTTDFDEAYKDATLELWLKVNKLDKGSVRIAFTDAKGKKLSITPSTIKLPETMDEFKYNIKVKSPLKWDAEHPNLYNMTLSLVDAQGKVTETIVRKFGFREAYRIDDEFFVNGKAVKFRGIWGVQDAALLKSLNINHTRQIGTNEAFLNDADEYGIYVLDEMSSGGSFGPNDDPDYRYQWIDLIGDMMERDYNHPSVIMWGLGNESHHGANVLAAFKYTKADDPQRMTMYSWANRVRPDEELPYDVYSMHYAPMSDPNYKPSTYGTAIWHSPSLIYDREVVPKIPVLVDESTHALLALEEEERDPNVRNFWGTSAKDMADRSWADRGSVGFDQYGMFAYVGRTTIPEIWHIRKAYSPIHIEKRDYDLPAPGAGLNVEVENRSNHTDLSEYTINWKVGEVSGTVKGPKAAPKATGVLTVPYKAFKAGDVVELAFVHPDGRQVDEYKLDVAREPYKLPALSDFPPQMTQNYKQVVVTGKDFELVYDKYKGQITSVKYKGETVITGGPHLQLLRSGLSLQEYWPQSSNAYMDGNEAVIDMDVIYSPIAAAFQLRIDGNGLITVNYTVKHTPDPAPAGFSIPWNKADMGGYSEVGIQFTLPGAVDRIQWDRKGIWSVYPEDHIGREQGVAYKSPEGLDTSVWTNFTYDLNWWAIWEQDTPEKLESPSHTTNDFRASKEYFRTVDALLKGKTIGVEAVSLEHDAVRMEPASLNGNVTMYINNEWNYPTLGVGNYMKPAIKFGDGYTNTVRLRLVDLSDK